MPVMFIQFGAIALILTSVLTAMFTALTDFFVRFVTKRVALSFAAISLFLALSAGFIATMSALLSGVVVIAPQELSIAWGWFMPDNADECLGAYFAAYTARWVYDTNYNLIFNKGLFGSM